MSWTRCDGRVRAVFLAGGLLTAGALAVLLAGRRPRAAPGLIRPG
ncbi:hypothetical protein [Streptomyces sp. NPDC101237]